MNKLYDLEKDSFVFTSYSFCFVGDSILGGLLFMFKLASGKEPHLQREGTMDLGHKPNEKEKNCTIGRG